MASISTIFADVTKLGKKLQTSEYLESGKYPIVDQGQDTIAGYTNQEDGVFTDVPVVIFGDHTRVVKYIDTPFFLGADGVKVLKGIRTDTDARYLYYAASAVRIPNTGYNRHFKWLKEADIPLPDLPTQRRIAATLDKVSEGIALCKQMLVDLEELVKARFVEMFGDMLINDMLWPEIPLEQLADVVSGITKGRKVTDTELFEVPYMAVSNVKDGYIDWTTVKTILATQKEIEQYRLLPYDVLMTEGGDPDKLGRGAVIAKPLENSIHQNHIFRVRLQKEKILPAFFSEYLQHQKAKRYFLGCAKQTTGIASINMTQLRALPVLTPPMELQKQFIAFIEQTDKSKFAVQQQLAELETLKKSLMQEYFG